MSTFSAFCDDGCQFFAQLSSRLQVCLPQCTLSNFPRAHARIDGYGNSKP